MTRGIVNAVDISLFHAKTHLCTPFNYYNQVNATCPLHYKNFTGEQT